MEEELSYRGRLENFIVDVLSWIVAIMIVLAILAAFFVSFAAGLHHTDHVNCLRLSEQTGAVTKMVGNAWDAECYIRIDGTMIPVDKWHPLAPVVR